MSNNAVRFVKGFFLLCAIVILMPVILRLVDFPRNQDGEGVEAARALVKPPWDISVTIEFPADVVASMTEIRTRRTCGLLGGEYFYSFKLHSNDVERLVQCFRLERVKTVYPPTSPRLPPWWEAIMKQWPTNAICYYRDTAPYKIYYLPDSQQCLFHWFRH